MTVAQIIAQELLAMQQGSVHDAMMLLQDSYPLTPREIYAIAKALHNIGQDSNCQCGGCDEGEWLV